MQPFKYNPHFNTGQFRNRISIQQLTETENQMGDTVTGWEEFKNVWAMIKTVRGKEIMQAGAIQGELTVRFVTHYTPGITNDMRIIYDGRTFEITAPPINDDELNKTLTIMAREVV
ncbi:putative head-tail adaptor [Bacillus phage vB_BhaS-171]|uniref:head closure Hc1 n=1 Tax=Bacillus phage vB_BhaS-171 TaxID=1775140 RepID=UPI000744B8F1|nr:head closure Hc1 [Bacillus phage vB_BhaS-171]ALY08068.1 putative head-tail adaptor [Bacillus phage vB_BhaS-171]